MSEWWNGRHASLRCLCPFLGCAGSNPASDTRILKSDLRIAFFIAQTSSMIYWAESAILHRAVNGMRTRSALDLPGGNRLLLSGLPDLCKNSPCVPGAVVGHTGQIGCLGLVCAIGPWAARIQLAPYHRIALISPLLRPRLAAAPHSSRHRLVLRIELDGCLVQAIYVVTHRHLFEDLGRRRQTLQPARAVPKGSNFRSTLPHTVLDKGSSLGFARGFMFLFSLID